MTAVSHRDGPDPPQRLHADGARPPSTASVNDRTVRTIELALRQGATALTEDLEQLLAALDSGGDSVRDHYAAVARRVDELFAQDPSRSPNLASAIDRVAALVTPSLPESPASPQSDAAPPSESWASLRRQLGEAYDALVEILRADVTEPRPTNFVRAAFHVTSALAGLVATLVVFTAEQLPFAAATLAVSSWALEILRRRSPATNAVLMRFFRHIARPGEALRINSGTWYMTALVVLTLTYSPLLCVVSVAVLGFADPAAAIIGRRFGRIGLRHGRTLEGTAAFVAVGTLAAVVVMALLPSPPVAAIAWPVAVAAALCGGLAELFSRRIDDNLAIPLAAMAGAWAMLGLLGASPW